MGKTIKPVKNLTINGNGTFNGNVPVMDFAYLDGYIYYIRDSAIYRIDTTDGSDKRFTTLTFDPQCTTIHAYNGKLIIYGLIRYVSDVFAFTANGEDYVYDYITNTIEVYTVDIDTKFVSFETVLSSSQYNWAQGCYFYFEPFNNSTCFIHNNNLYVVGHLMSTNFYNPAVSTGVSHSDIPAVAMETEGTTTSAPFVARANLDNLSLGFAQNTINFSYTQNNAGYVVGYTPPVVSSVTQERPLDGISALSYTKLASYTKAYEQHSKAYGDFNYGIRGGIPIVKSGNTIYLLPALPNIANYTAYIDNPLHNDTMFVCSVSDIDIFLTTSVLNCPTNSLVFTYSELLTGHTQKANLTDSKGISSPACVVGDNIYLFGGITYDETAIYTEPAGSNTAYFGSQAIHDSIEVLSKIKVYNITTGTVTEKELPYPNSKGGCTIVDGEYIYVPTDDGIGIYTLDYDTTYSIKGSNVDISLENCAPISKVKFSSANGYQYYDFETEVGSITGSYESKPPTGYQIIGYSLKQGVKIPDFTLGKSYEVSIDKDTTFYEVYSVNRPPTESFELELYRNKAERNRVDKTEYLDLVGEIQGALREECSLTSPVITIEFYDVPNFNYVYIDKFMRWYYVTDITSLRANLWVISLSVDVLMTYKDGIYNCSAFIDRNEEDYDPLIVDNKLPLKQGQKVTEYTLNNTVFTDGTGQFLLTGILVSQGDSITKAQTLSDVTEAEFEPLSTVEETVEEISEESEVQDNGF